MHEVISRVIERPSRPAVGSANTVIVCGSVNDVIATVTTVHAQLMPREHGRMFSTLGPGTIHPATLQHYEEVLSPVINDINEHLPLPQSSFAISISNIDVSAVQSRKLVIEGFSADAAVFVACVSAMLNVPCQSDVVATAHVASTDGALGLVDNIPAKLHAACNSKRITRFLCANPDRENSLARMDESEYELIQSAIRRATGSVSVSFVENLADVLRMAFHEREFVLSGLVNHYFQQTSLQYQLIATVDHISTGLPERFWSLLETTFQESHPDQGHDLLRAYVQYFLHRDTYPSGFGTRLYYLLASLPLATLQGINFPLVSPELLLSLIRRAGVDDFDDVRRLFDSFVCDQFPPPVFSAKPASGLGRTPDVNDDLAALLAIIDPDVVQRQITLPIEHAMATYRLDASRLAENQSCVDVVSSWYLHLLRHTNRIISASPNAIQDEAMALMDRAFARRGGIKGAEAEARTGAAHGGIRYVLEVLGTQFAREKEQDYVYRALMAHLELLPYSRRVALLNAFFERFKDFLAADDQSIPPQQLLDKGEVLARIYMQTTASLRNMFRSM